MRIYRFDPEVSVPIDHFGSDFRLGRLTSDDAAGRVQVMYLAKGGTVGRHPADCRQLFAVVSGAGWVSGSDGERRPIEAGQAVVWELGEDHAAGTEGGLTAVCLEGAFDMDAVAVTKEIVVSDYDPEWPEWFERIRDYVWPAIAGMSLRIDHVGSTSVPGLAAKPIIDLDVVVAEDSGVPPVVAALKTLGYRWVGDLGVEGRQAFTPPVHPLPQHHLYLVVQHNKAHLDHVLLRDLLREDDAERNRYGALKRDNVALARGDIDVYVAAKAALVAELLTRARAERGLEPASYWEPDRPGGGAP